MIPALRIARSVGHDQCMNIFGRIEGASLSFYQRRESWNYVHDFWIMPSYGVVKAGDEYSHHSGYKAKWQSIDLNNAKINSVVSALQVAEQHGGSEARTLAKNECKISILLAPDRIKYDILSHPFTPYGWGWEILYWSNKPNRSPGPLFGINVDPYTGKYKVLRSE